MEDLDVGYRELWRSEDSPHQVGVLVWPCCLPHDLANREVVGQADVVPLARDSYVRQVATYVRARRLAAEAPGDQILRVGLVEPVWMAFELLASVCSVQAVVLHYPVDAPAARRYVFALQRRLYLARPVASSAVLVRGEHVGLDGQPLCRTVPTAAAP